MTLMLPERDEEVVDRNPQVSWQDLHERQFCLNRFRGLNETEPVADPVNVRIDTDRRNLKSHAEHEVGGFSSNTRQGKQLVARGRDVAVVTLGQDRRNLAELTCLGIVESGRIDGASDRSFVELHERVWRLGECE